VALYLTTAVAQNPRGTYLRSPKQVRQLHANPGNAIAGKRRTAFRDGDVEIRTIFRPAMDFNPALDRQNDPILVDTRLRVQPGK